MMVALSGMKFDDSSFYIILLPTWNVNLSIKNNLMSMKMPISSEGGNIKTENWKWEAENYVKIVMRKSFPLQLVIPNSIFCQNTTLKLIPI